MTIQCIVATAACWLLATSATWAADGAGSNPLQLSPHHATASVADLDKESDWYGRVLGFSVVTTIKNGPDFALRQMGIPGYRIDLLWQKGSRPRQAAGSMQQGWFHVVFKTPAMDAALKRLTELGTDVKADKNAQGALTRLIVHDPEGNEIEIEP